VIEGLGLRSGDKVRHCSKFEYEQEKPFEAWLKQARPAD
jgi:hypothetical protein